jgi:hypothetical protein
MAAGQGRISKGRLAHHNHPAGAHIETRFSPLDGGAVVMGYRAHRTIGAGHRPRSIPPSLAEKGWLPCGSAPMLKSPTK